MIYVPHTLYVLADTEASFDEFGNPVPSPEENQWVVMRACRCDDNDTARRITLNGSLFDFSYHIVCEGQATVDPGSTVRVTDENGMVRAEGRVVKCRRCNFMNFAELWI